MSAIFGKSYINTGHVLAETQKSKVYFMPDNLKNVSGSEL